MWSIVERGHYGREGDPRSPSRVPDFSWAKVSLQGQPGHWIIDHITRKMSEHLEGAIWSPGEGVAMACMIR